MRLRAAAPDRGDRRQRGVLFHGVHAAVPRTVVPQIHHGMAGTARHRTGGHAPVRHERPVGAAVPVHSARGRGPACLLGGTIGPAETPIDALLRNSGELSVRGVGERGVCHDSTAQWNVPIPVCYSTSHRQLES